MKRNLKQMVNIYDNGNEKDAFYSSDYQQIFKLSIEQTDSDRKNRERYGILQTDRISDILYNAIDIALKSGFMIGYQQAHKENKKNDDQTNYKDL